MTTIAATGNSSTGAALAALIAGSTESAVAPAGTAATPSSSSASTKTGLGPATVVDLSYPAKAAVAKAQSDQAAAARLQAYVEAHSVHGNANGGSSTNKTSQSDPFQNILDETTATPVAPTIAPTNTALANIQAIANAETPQPYVPFTPTRSLSTSLNFAGYTVTVNTNASTQYYGAEINGNGLSTSDKHFGPSAGFCGGGTQPPGVEVSTSSTTGDEVTFTITSNTASASGASIASSNGSAATAQSVSAQSSTVTFVVNYATGQIQASRSAASISAQSTSSREPGSLLSALA